MAQNVNINGTWKTAVPYVKVSDTWKVPKSIYNKVSDKWYASFLQGGTEDLGFTDFDIYTGFNNETFSSVIQPDGKIIVAGSFITYNSASRRTIVRFNSNMTLDTTFNTNIGTGSNATVYRVALQSDGKIIVVGNFTSWNGTTVGNIVRLNADGTRDTAFTTNTGTGTTGTILTALVQSDGKIVLGGFFTTWNGTTINRVVRLNSDGSVDSSFSTNIGTASNGFIYSIGQQSDGKLLIGGSGFTTWNGATVGNIVRLNLDGTRDTAFTTSNGTGANFGVLSLAIQSDGKIVIGGNFTSWNSITANRFTRLNSDGSLDTSFNTNVGTGINNGVNDVEIQSDGKIIVGGLFTTFNSVSINRFARVNSNGTLDTTFNNNIGSGFDNTVNSMLIQSDQKIIVLGSYTIFNNNVTNRITRLNTDGTFDSSFINIGAAFNAPVNSIVVQSDGKMVAVGSFQYFNNTLVNRIVRLNTDGTIDSSFLSNTGSGANNSVSSLAIQSDGKILVGGSFTSWNGATVSSIVRLNSDGTRDTAFTTNGGTGANGTIDAIAIQSDGKIIIGGNFFTTFNGTTVGRIARLNSNGSLDTTFTTNNGTGANGNVQSIAIQSDGRIVIVGGFFQWNGASTLRIARLNSDGTRDTAFTTNGGTGVTGSLLCVTIQSDGKILIGGSSFSAFNGTTVGNIARLNADGSLDTAFTTNNGSGANGPVRSILLQSNGRMLIGGGFIQFATNNAYRLARLNSNGTFDSNFSTNTGFGVNDTVNFISSHIDDRVIVGGAFTTFNERIRNRIVRVGSSESYS